MLTPRHTRMRRSDGSVPRTIARYSRVTLALLPHGGNSLVGLRPTAPLAAMSAVSGRARHAQGHKGHATHSRWWGSAAPEIGLPQSMRQIGTAMRQALPDAASLSRFAHSASVTGVMVGIAFGLWAAPTLAHWNTDPGLRSATLTTTTDVSSARLPSKHWVRVTDRESSGAAPSRAARDDGTPPVPDRAYAVPRGDLRKDISDANRDAGPRTGFGGR